MKVNEQLLMSYLTDLESLDNILARLSPEAANSLEKPLLDIGGCLYSALTHLMELLTSEPNTCDDGSDSVPTSE